MKYVKVDIKKPLFGTFCYIRSKYIDQAKRQNIPLRITIPQGTAIISTQDWMKDARKMVKEFKIKGTPMILWGNYVPLVMDKVHTECPLPEGAEQLSLI